MSYPDFFGINFNCFINSEATANFLEKRGYILITLGELIKKKYEFKTKKEIQDKYFFTSGVLNSILAYKPEESPILEGVLNMYMLGIREMITRGGYSSKPYHRISKFSMWWLTGNSYIYKGKPLLLGRFGIDCRARNEILKYLGQEIDIFIPNDI